MRQKGAKTNMPVFYRLTARWLWTSYCDLISTTSVSTAGQIILTKFTRLLISLRQLTSINYTTIFYTSTQTKVIMGGQGREGKCRCVIIPLQRPH